MINQKHRKDLVSVRRADIINSLPHGAMKRLAKELNCTKGYVSFVLNGHAAQTSPLAAEIIAKSEAIKILEIEKLTCKRKGE